MCLSFCLPVFVLGVLSVDLSFCLCFLYLSPSSVSCVAARKIVRRSCLRARPRYNLVVDEDVKKPTKQTNKQTLSLYFLSTCFVLPVCFFATSVSHLHNLCLSFHLNMHLSPSLSLSINTLSFSSLRPPTPRFPHIHTYSLSLIFFLSQVPSPPPFQRY